MMAPANRIGLRGGLGGLIRLLPIVGLASEVPASAAPAIAYGGSATLTVWGSPVPPEPSDLTAWGHRAVAALTYEGLYRCAPGEGLEPVLASGAARLEGRTLTIPLRTDVLRHDGQILSGAEVAEALLRLRRGARPGAYVLTPVQGHRQAVRGASGVLRLDLRASYEGAARLLCSAHARIAVRVPGGLTGTGPFKAGQIQGRTQTYVPFVHHREGRPFLDSVKVRSVPDKATAARAATADPVILLDAPDVGTKRWPAPSDGFEELVLLVLGPGLNREAFGSRLSEAIDSQRARLAQKWRSVKALPARCLVAEPCRRPAGANGQPIEPQRLPLLVASTARWRASFTSRVQVALAPLGLMVPIITKDPKDLTSGSRPAASVWLTSVILPPRRDDIDRLHALFALTAALGRPDVLSESEWVPVAEGRASVEPLEQQVRSRMGLVPLVRAPVIDIVRSKLSGLDRGAGGVLRLSDAHLGSRRSP